MKRFTLNFLLTLCALVGGVNVAWAATGDVTTNVDIDFSNPITGTKPYTIEGTVGKMTWTAQWTMAPNITDGILQFGNFDGGVVNLENNTIGAKDVVTISFELAFGKLNGKHVGFTFRDTDDNDILTQWFDAYNGDFDDSNPLNLDWISMYRGSNTVIQERCVYFTITLDYAQSKITTKTKCYMSGASKPATEAEYTAALPSTTPLGAFVLQGNINNTGRYCTFDNLKITTTKGDYSAATANYTVNWVCDGEIVKTETRSGDVDANITLLSSDNDNFLEGDAKYIYVSDDASEQTIASDGTTVVTITFREAQKYSYFVTSSYDGNPLDWSISGSVWEDENSVKVNYPRYQAYETTLVGRAPVNNNLTTTIQVTEDGFTTDLEYASEGITDLYLLSEAENLETGLSTNATTYTDRVSNSLIVFGASGSLLTLPAGKYIFTLGAIGGDNTNHKVQYVVKAGGETIIEGTCTGNFLTNLTSEEFTLYGETPITFTCSDPASGRGIDLVYVQKTGEAPTSVPVTVSSAGYATLCSSAALDFSAVEGLKAYVAEVNDMTVNFKEVQQAPANTGLLLKGEGEFEVPVIASADAVETNYLVGVMEETPIEVANNYVLMNGDSGVGFYKVSAEGFTVRAGSAYLSLPAISAKMFIGFDGDTATAIQSVDAAKADKDAPAYNLAGQRVSGQYKGIVVRGGHKIVIK